MILRLRGGGVDPNAVMGIAAGGLIKQTIIKDTHDPTIWEPSCGTIFNVQILNSASFRQVTGMDAPTTPVTAATYAQHGYPYYDLWDEKSSGIAGNFDGVKSVNEKDLEGAPTLQKAQAVAETIKSTNNAVISLDADGQRIGFRPVPQMEEEVRKKFRGTTI